MNEKVEVEMLARQGLVHEAMDVAKQAGIDDQTCASIITKGLISMQINFSFLEGKIIE
jgi:3-hydroxyisobutyrate dehydrogenase-like beta-hydroxyacid dehydrogenase